MEAEISGPSLCWKVQMSAAPPAWSEAATVIVAVDFLWSKLSVSSASSDFLTA